jgi:hypothetical protein
MVPYHTIAFSQQKLRAALRRSEGQELEFGYGFVVHARRHNEHPALGIITLNGESFELTDRHLAALTETPLWLFGHARITFDAGEPLPGVDVEQARRREAAIPLSSLLMHIATFDPSTGVTKHLVQVEAVVKAETLVQPLVVLAPARPAAWPL